MIQIDTDWLLEALDDHDELVHHHLDTQTGEIRCVSDMFDSTEELEELYEQMDESPGRWITIDPYPSRDGFRIMEAFVEGLPDDEGRRTLQRALSWKKPFSNFRDALREMPTLRDKWFAFHRERMIEVAREWLRVAGVDAELV